MGDYQLERLNPRDFEHLVQAMALEHIGPTVTVFGDGPDGGREATFEGSTRYPSDEYPWSGYGVIQAKFRQRLKDDDSKWAVRQLKDETKEFGARKRTPRYYIFATNAALSAVETSGGLDVARKHLQGLVDEGPLLDFDVWDYNKLCRLLDGLPNLVRRYAAWISPGDIVAELCKQIDVSTPDFDEVLTETLKRDILRDQYAKLEQGGGSTDQRVLISNVFIDIPYETRRFVSQERYIDDAENEMGLVDQLIKSGNERLPTGLQRTRTDQEGVDPNDPSRFILVGGPGQGKSTVVQFLCQAYRAALLQTKNQFDLTPETIDILNEIQDGLRAEGIELPRSRRFPIRVDLPSFAAWLTRSEGNSSLLAFLANQLESRSDINVDARDLRSWFRAYPMAFFLDGLDEVPASSNRGDVVDAIQSFWADTASSDADMLALITTRPQGYTGEFDERRFQHLYLQPLRVDRALEYGRRLSANRFRQNEEKQSRINRRLLMASEEPATAKLMTTPLQVTIMATLLERIGAPPRRRYDLFSDYYDVIYNRELERDIPASGILRDYRADIDAVHRRVGLRLQSASESRGSTESRLTTEELKTEIVGRLGSEGYDEASLDAAAEQLMATAANRLVFLVGVEEGRVGFEIRSLQEFMAAQALLDGADNLVEDRLRHIAPISSWRNVFLFCAGGIFSKREHLRDLVYTICTSLNDDDDDFLLGYIDAGSRLAVDLLDDQAITSPRFERLFAELALGLIRRGRSDEIVRLVSVASSPTASVLRRRVSDALEDPSTIRRGEMYLALALAASDEAVAGWLSSVSVLESIDQFGALDPILHQVDVEGPLWNVLEGAVIESGPRRLGPVVYSGEWREGLLTLCCWNLSFRGANSSSMFQFTVGTGEQGHHAFAHDHDSFSGAVAACNSVDFSDHPLRPSLQYLVDGSYDGDWGRLGEVAEMALSDADVPLDAIVDRLRGLSEGALTVVEASFPWIFSSIAGLGRDLGWASTHDFVVRAPCAWRRDELLAWESRWQEEGIGPADVLAVDGGQWLPPPFEEHASGMPYLPRFVMIRPGGIETMRDILRVAVQIKNPAVGEWFQIVLLVGNPQETSELIDEFGCEEALSAVTSVGDGVESILRVLSVDDWRHCEAAAMEVVNSVSWESIPVTGLSHTWRRRALPDWMRRGTVGRGSGRLVALLGSPDDAYSFRQRAGALLEGDESLDLILRIAEGGSLHEPARFGEDLCGALERQDVPTRVALSLLNGESPLDQESLEGVLGALLEGRKQIADLSHDLLRNAVASGLERRRSRLAEEGELRRMGLR